MEANKNIVIRNAPYCTGTYFKCRIFGEEKDNASDDIDTLYGTIFEREMSEDELANYLLGLKTIYDIKFNQLFSIFENMIAKGMIRDA